MDHIVDGSKMYFIDVETSGITRSDMVRSVSVREGSLSPSTSGTGRLLDTIGEDVGARFNTPQMASLVSADPTDLNRVTSFGDAVIKRETDLGGPAASRLPKFDLTSAGGRVSAAKYYKDKFRLFSEGDAHVVGYNVRFDIDQLINSAKQLPEFMDDPEAVALLGRFQKRMFEDGGMIDVLPMLKSRLKDQVSKRMRTAIERGDEAGVAAMAAVDALFATGGEVGERVSGFGLENVIQSTDFLYNLARSGSREEMEVLQTLAGSSASHIDVTDTAVTRMVVKQMLSDTGINLHPETGIDTTGISPERLAMVERAVQNVAGSKAMTATVTLADPRYLTKRTLDYLYNNEQAFQRINIQDELQAVIGTGSPLDTITTLNPKLTPTTRGTVSYVDGVAQFQPNIAGEAPITLNDSLARAYIRNELDAIRAVPAGTDIGRTSVVTGLGINPIQQTNIERVGSLLAEGVSSPIGTPVTTHSIMDISSSIAANETAFTQGLTATGNITGFTSGLAPGSETGMMGVIRHPLQAMSEVGMRKYADALYKAGIASASLNPEVRSAVVSLSAITAPIGVENTGLISGALAATKHPISGIPVARSAEELTSVIGATRETLASNMPLLSDIGIVHAKPQKALSITDSLVVVPYNILKEMESLDDFGRPIKLIDRLQGIDSKSARVRLSVATRRAEATPTVNVVYGGSLGESVTELAKRRARVEAESLARLTEPIKGMGAAKMIEERSCRIRTNG